VIPLPQLGLEFLLGLGAALAAGNAWALLKPNLDRRQGRKPVARLPAPGRAWRNVAIGAAVAIWALASLISRG
jgi:hypothetical protein